jgi:hypothetical protein
VGQKEPVTIAKALPRQPIGLHPRKRRPSDIREGIVAISPDVAEEAKLSPASARRTGRRKGWSHMNDHTSCISHAPQIAWVRTHQRNLMKRLGLDLERRPRLSRLLLRRRILFHREQSRQGRSRTQKRSQRRWFLDRRRQRIGSPRDPR